MCSSGDLGEADSGHPVPRQPLEVASLQHVIQVHPADTPPYTNLVVNVLLTPR